MKYLTYLTFILMITSCAYNSEEELYPGEVSCDTTDVSFSSDVLPIMENNCTNCHDSSNPPLGISLESYSDITDIAGSGRLLGAIKHEAGYTPMPQGAPQLQECKIAAIEAWIKDGMPDN